jgi:hypothetical protein
VLKEYLPDPDMVGSGHIEKDFIIDIIGTLKGEELEEMLRVALANRFSKDKLN